MLKANFGVSKLFFFKQRINNSVYINKVQILLNKLILDSDYNLIKTWKLKNWSHFCLFDVRSYAEVLYRDSQTSSGQWTCAFSCRYCKLARHVPSFNKTEQHKYSSYTRRIWGDFTVMRFWNSASILTLVSVCRYRPMLVQHTGRLLALK